MKRYAFLMALAAAFYASESVQGWQLYSLLFLGWLATGGYHTCYLSYHTLGRDLR